MDKWKLLYGYVCEQEKKSRAKSNDYFTDNNLGEDWATCIVKATTFEHIRYAMDEFDQAAKKMNEINHANSKGDQ